MSEEMVLALIAAVTTVVTSSGLWAYAIKHQAVRSANNRLLRGLAYDKIVTLGITYIQRGYVSKDEYEEYLKYLVEPYLEMGGNGVAERISREVGSLPFRTLPFREVHIKGEDEHGQ
jgi:hypothetical protein